MIKELKNYKLIDKISIILLIFVISGIIGFIYETVFYRIDLGYFVKRGTTFGPWIPIYGFGSLFISFITYKFKDKKTIVFIMSLIITTIIEFLTGYALFHIFNLRLWDYNTEILNFGNIGGYICLRSVLLFAFGGLFIIYFMLPFIFKIFKREKYIYNYISIVLGFMFILDIIVSNVIK